MKSMQIIKQLYKKYNTYNPFELAEYLDCITLKVPLEGVRGFYQFFQRNNIIYIDNKLTYDEQLFTCAHELGHALLHKKTNVMFLDSRTFLVTSKFEIEANRFATSLILTDDILNDFKDFSSAEIANCFGIAEPLVSYRLKEYFNN